MPPGIPFEAPLTRVSICDTSLRQHNINHCPNHQCKPQHSKREQQIDNYIVLICAVLWLCTIIFCRVHSCRWAGMHCTVIASTTAGAGRTGKCALEGLRIVGVTLCTLAKISVICHVLYILSVPTCGLLRWLYHDKGTIKRNASSHFVKFSGQPVSIWHELNSRQSDDSWWCAASTSFLNLRAAVPVATWNEFDLWTFTFNSGHRRSALLTIIKNCVANKHHLSISWSAFEKNRLNKNRCHCW